MKLVNQTKDVWQLNRFINFSCLILEQVDGLILIDTNLPGSSKGIVSFSTDRNKPIKTILLTHGHSDHVGSLDVLIDAYPQAEVIASARTARFMAGDLSQQPEDAGRKLRGGFLKVRTRPTRIVADGDTVGGFVVVATPGHSPDHNSYFHPATGYLFSGDALISAGGGLHVSGEWRLRFPFPYFATFDKKQAIDCARKLLALKPSWIFPTHGRGVDNAEVCLKKAIADAEA